MSFHEDPSQAPDESFGPGTDLVISLFAMLMLLLVLAVRALYVASAALPEPETQSANLWELREDYREEPLFERDKAVLTPRAKAQLLHEVPAILDALETSYCNQLLVEGYASPEAPSRLSRAARERWNLKLSVDRSMAVIDYLYRHGVPYECMSVTGFGRSHSLVLANWLKYDPMRSIIEWDDEWGDWASEIGETALAEERVVRIFGIYHESSLCDLTRRPSVETSRKGGAT